jgi:hypothetical protein
MGLSWCGNSVDPKLSFANGAMTAEDDPHHFSAKFLHSTIQPQRLRIP